MRFGLVTHLRGQLDTFSYGPFVARLAERFTVIRYDKPGCGLSDRDGTDLSFDGQVAAAAGISFRFRAGPGVEDWVRDLARREKECCGFFEFTVTADGREVRWDASAGDGEAARRALAGFYRLADTPGVTPGPALIPGRGRRNRSGPARQARTSR